MRIQILSDLHLEHTGLAPPASGADVLIAAGDIAHGLDGLRWLDELARPVIYVAGNHEYWADGLHGAPARLRAAAAGSAVRFLERESTVIDGVRFLGCTLWGDYGLGRADIATAIEQAMNDFQHIRSDGDPVRARDLLSAHEAARGWLGQALARPFDGPTVVVTHHAPSFRSWKGPADSPYRHACCSDLEVLVETPGVALWVHGHLHHVLDYRCGTARVLCNPRGYADNPARGFDPQRTVEI